MLGVGGAMDLVVGARRVIVTMTSTSSRGEPKIVAACTYPLTAKAAADVVITEQAVFRFRDGLVLTRAARGRDARRRRRRDGRALPGRARLMSILSGSGFFGSSSTTSRTPFS